MGFASGGSNVPVRHFFVNLSFVARSEFCAKNPARTQSPKTLGASVEQRSVQIKNDFHYPKKI